MEAVLLDQALVQYAQYLSQTLAVDVISVVKRQVPPAAGEDTTGTGACACLPSRRPVLHLSLYSLYPCFSSSFDFLVVPCR